MALTPYKEDFNSSSGMLYGFYDIKTPLTADDLRHWGTIVIDYHMFFDENKKGEMEFVNLGNDKVKISGTYKKTLTYPIKKALEILNDHIVHSSISPEKLERMYGKKWLSVDESESKGFKGFKTSVPQKKQNLADTFSKNFRKML